MMRVCTVVAVAVGRAGGTWVGHRKGSARAGAAGAHAHAHQVCLPRRHRGLPPTGLAGLRAPPASLSNKRNVGKRNGGPEAP